MRWRRYSQAQEAPSDSTHCKYPSIDHQHSPRTNSPRRPRAPIPSTTAILPTLSLRTLTTTPALYKKGKNTAPRDSQKTGTKEAPAEWDPEDFSALRAGIVKANDKLSADLAKLRSGGRFNPEILENVRVHLDKDSKKTHRVGELAQVIPKGGRSVMLLIGEKDHVKPIISAIQNSKELNLQPVPDPHNPSQLNVPLPAPTKESRDAALAAAHDVGEAAKAAITGARGVMQKKLRQMEIKETALPDELKKARKEMEKIVQGAVADVKKTVDAARKGMEQA
jgi:ribosome recycling factor